MFQPIISITRTEASPPLVNPQRTGPPDRCSDVEFFFFESCSDAELELTVGRAAHHLMQLGQAGTRRQHANRNSNLKNPSKKQQPQDRGSTFTELSQILISKCLQFYTIDRQQIQYSIIFPHCILHSTSPRAIEHQREEPFFVINHYEQHGASAQRRLLETSSWTCSCRPCCIPMLGHCNKRN